MLHLSLKAYPKYYYVVVSCVIHLLFFLNYFEKFQTHWEIGNTVWLLYIHIYLIYHIYIILYSFLDVSSVDTWPHLLYLSLPVDFCVNTHIFSCWDIWWWVAGIVLPHPKYFNIFSKNQDIYHSFPVGCTILHSCQPRMGVSVTIVAKACSSQSNFGYSRRCVEASHCGFNLHFPDE